MRGPFLGAEVGRNGHDGHFVVHGHTIPRMDRSSIERQVMHARVNLDGGSYDSGLIRPGRFVDGRVTVEEF